MQYALHLHRKTCFGMEARADYAERASRQARLEGFGAFPRGLDCHHPSWQAGHVHIIVEGWKGSEVRRCVHKSRAGMTLDGRGSGVRVRRKRK